MTSFWEFKGGRNPEKSKELNKVINKLKKTLNQDQKNLLKEYLYLKADSRHRKI